ncbi:CAP family protein [Microbispora sp. ATCC PTA-5024]|uniref:CAP family protein n=1 Tax=Microbispora sp. ATCC PTA-5024 TaxID=316330 RepID=UPI0018DDC460|nr:CAP family protein [Microbispora sp. ATCC PTA-5024]
MPTFAAAPTPLPSPSAPATVTPSPAPTAPPPASADAAFAAGMLAEHNAYRARHGSPPLSLDPALTAFAADWARTIAAAGTLKHSTAPQLGYGENLYWGAPAQPTPAAIVKAWYDRIASYDWSKPGYDRTSGPFTQVVWKSSTRLGVGLARSAHGGWYAVAVYAPGGNVIGQYVDNVPRPL